MGKKLDENDQDLLLNHNTNFKSALRPFPTRREVQRVNQFEFDQLSTEKRVFRSIDVFEPGMNYDPFVVRKSNTRALDGSLHELRDHRFARVCPLCSPPYDIMDPLMFMVSLGSNSITPTTIFISWAAAINALTTIF